MVGKIQHDEFAMGSSPRISLRRDAQSLAAERVPGGRAAVGGGGGRRAWHGGHGDRFRRSVRQPAAFCGVTGVKPTYGRVSR